MTGCVAPTGEWKLDGTVKHTENESTSSPYSTPTPDVVYVTPTPKVVYVTQTPEIVYVTQTPTPTPNPYEDCWNLGNHHICNNEDSTRAGLSALLTVEDMSDRYRTVGIAHTTGNYVMVYGVRWTDWGNDFLIFDPSRDDFITLFDEDQSILPSVVVIEYEAMQRYSIDIPDDPGVVYATPTPEPTPYLEPHRGGCEGLDQSVLKRYDFDNNGLIDSNEMEKAKIGYESNYEKPSDYAQILYAYEHSCPVWSTVSPTPTPEPTVAPTPETMFIDPVITIEPPIYSGVVRNNGEILDIRITPDPPIAGDDATVEVDVLNTGTVESCYELHWHAAPSGVYEEEAWIYAGDMETFTYTSRIRNPGGRTWTFKLYWDAEWPASNVLLQTATVDVHCYTQYEVDNM
jgi:hypothetical protein